MEFSKFRSRDRIAPAHLTHPVIAIFNYTRAAGGSPNTRAFTANNVTITDKNPEVFFKIKQIVTLNTKSILFRLARKSVSKAA